VTRSARRTLASSSVSIHHVVRRVLLDHSSRIRIANVVPIGEVGKVLGEKWKALGEKQKAPYEAKAAADKKRYEEEKAAYTAVSRVAIS
jgi:hypothetical protein